MRSVVAMDFSSLLKEALPSLGVNITGQNYTRRSLPDGRAQFLPLLGSRANPLVHMLTIVYDLLGTRLGLDPTLMLTFFGFVWAFNRMGRQIYGMWF